MKLFTVSFGCQMNTADTEEMSRALADKGFQFTQEQDEADAILINTCTVRQHAEDRAFSLVGNLKAWKKQDPERLLIIAGCAAERTKENLQKRFPYVDLVVGAKSIEQFPEIVEEALKEKYNWDKDNKGFESFEIATASDGLAMTERGTHCNDGPIAHVTTMRGCNYSCTYCIVPFVRGRESYRDPQAIEKEIRQRTQEGAKEILFLGQTVNSFNRDGWNFAKLLKMAGAVEGVERIRFMSPHPYYMSDELIEAMAVTPAVCEHLHLPLQSGSDRMLALMQRNYTVQKYRNILKRLRAAIPGISITTDFIAGFPGETEEDFRETLEFAREMEFDGAYCFKFSPREGTKAAQMEGPVPEKVIEERHARLLDLTEEISRQTAKRHLGQTVEVLLEEPGLGRTRRNYWMELGEGLEGKAGELRKVTVASVKSRRLYAMATQPQKV